MDRLSEQEKGSTFPPVGQIKRMTFLQATLKNGRRAELKSGTLSVWTRSGEELVFSSEDVQIMAQMFKTEADLSQSSK